MKQYFVIERSDCLDCKGSGFRDRSVVSNGGVMEGVRYVPAFSMRLTCSKCFGRGWNESCVPLVDACRELLAQNKIDLPQFSC